MRNPHYPRFGTLTWFRMQWFILNYRNPNLVEDWYHGEVAFGARLNNFWLGLRVAFRGLLGYRFLGWKKS